MGKKVIVNFDIDQSSVELMKTIMPIADELGHEIMDFVDTWLKTRGMEIITDDREFEPVVATGATTKGYGHVRLNVHFKKTQ